MRKKTLVFAAVVSSLLVFGASHLTSGEEGTPVPWKEVAPGVEAVMFPRVGGTEASPDLAILRLSADAYAALEDRGPLAFVNALPGDRGTLFPKPVRRLDRCVKLAEKKSGADSRWMVQLIHWPDSLGLCAVFPMLALEP